MVVKMAPKFTATEDVGKWLEAGKRGSLGLFRPNNVAARDRSRGRKGALTSEELSNIQTGEELEL